MKYDFENDLQQNLMSMEIVDARRFAVAIRDAMRSLKRDAGGYKLQGKDYYVDTQSFLEKMATRLEAREYIEREDRPERSGEYTLFHLLMRYSGDQNKVKLYECRHSIIGDGAPYPWPEEDLIASAPAIGAYLDRTVHRWEVVDGCLHAVVGYILGNYENHY